MSEGAPKKREASAKDSSRRDFLRQALAAALAPAALSWDALQSSAHALNVPPETPLLRTLEALFASTETEKFESLAYILHHPEHFPDGTSVDVSKSIAQRSIWGVSGKGIQLFFNVLYGMQGNNLLHAEGTTVLCAHTHTKAGHLALFPKDVLQRIATTGRAYVGLPSTTDFKSTAMHGLRRAQFVLAHHDAAFADMPPLDACDLVVTNAGVYTTRALPEHPPSAIDLEKDVPPVLERAWGAQNVAWILFVNASLKQGHSWDTILASPEYATVQHFAREHFGVRLNFVPRSKVTVGAILEK